MEKISDTLRKLTPDDLREWTGSKIFSRGKSYIRNVDGLSCMEDGTLTAWVSGSDEYATSIRPAISSICGACTRSIKQPGAFRSGRTCSSNCGSSTGPSGG